MAGGLDFGPEFFDKFGVTFEKGDIIFCEYEPGLNFYFLLEGRVKIIKILSDKEKILDILNPGELFGEMSIIEEAPRSATIVALDNVKALEFNKANFEVIMTAKPEMAIKILKVFANRIYDQKRRLKILTLPYPEAKVADVFVMLAEQRQLNLSETKEVSFDITPEQVGSWCGMDVAKCKAILAHFAKQNRIVISPPNKITVININDFYRLVNSRKRNTE
jgi:CRP/FNR family transcriptional regulator, cyclic AMP receptor protein